MPDHTQSPALSPPRHLPDDGLLVGYSLEHERRRAPAGFRFAEGAVSPEPPLAELNPVLHTGDGHLITLAPTGAGKGIGFVVPALLRHRGQIIVIDPKGENYAITARRRREMGDEVHVFDPFGVTDAPVRATLNPLDYIDPAKPGWVDEVAALGALLATQKGHVDPFWDERAEHVIVALLTHIVCSAPNGVRTLGELNYLLNQSQRDLEFTVKEMSLSKAYEVKLMAGMIAGMEPRVRASVITSAQRFVEFLRSKPMRDALAGGAHALDLDGLAAGAPMAIYLVIPPDKLESHGRFLRLITGQLMNAVLWRKQPPKQRTLFVLDEAAQLGTLAVLRQAVTLLRGYGLQTWTFWQDLSQLSRLYPHDWETMLNNARTVQIFGIANMRMAKQATELSGFEDTRALLDLDADEMLLMISGDEAVIAQRPNYLTDPGFAGLADVNPFHAPFDDEEVTARRPQRRYRRPPHREAAPPATHDRHRRRSRPRPCR